jgi:hypothetical protein
MENWPSKGEDADKLYIQGATVPLGTPPAQAGSPAPANDNQDDKADAA